MLNRVQWVESSDFVASGVLIPMMTIVVLKNLCIAGQNVSFPAFVGPNLISNLV